MNVLAGESDRTQIAGNFTVMYGSTKFDVYINGQRYGGWWELKDGAVLVSSAYGSRSAKPGRRKPEAVAEEVLREILAERFIQA